VNSPQANLISPAKQEFLKRLEARGSFLEWCRLAGYEPATHHRLIIGELEQLVNNLFKALVRGSEIETEPLRLMVMTPPGSAKSTYISKLFPPWFLAQMSRLENQMIKVSRRAEPLGILACSHNAELATDFGRAARNLIKSNERWLGFALQQDSRAADKWSATNGGYYQAAGVNSGISGRRMHLGAIDDFCGAEADATSKLFNDQTWIWYENDFVNRLQPISARVIIANHRNEDDLCGRILSKEPHKWRVIRLRLLIETTEQAENDPLHRKVGEHLWPEYFTAAQVAERMQNPRASGIQQQEPSPEKGAIFQKEWFKGYEPNELPSLNESRSYGASDHAVRTKTQNDMTCMGTARFYNKFLFIHPDLVWDRIRSDKAITEMFRLIKTNMPVNWWAEKENISGSLGPLLQNMMMEQKVFACVTEVSHGNKDLIARSQPVIGLMAMGLVRFPKWAPWYQRFEKEMLMFPNGRHDDAVSFMILLCQGINRMRQPSPPTIVPEFNVNQPFIPTVKWLKDGEARNKRLRMLAMNDD
jgi:predicted phage terminase large subunit-like protein